MFKEKVFEKASDPYIFFSPKVRRLGINNTF